MQQNITREKHKFKNSNGETLAALLEKPAGKVKAVALFAHCFTCSKNIGVAGRISHTLAAKGFAVLRFDFTGLGNSEGDFANTNFSSNIEDLISAAQYLQKIGLPVDLLIGHSLGGAAVLAAAHEIDTGKAVVTVGAPYEPAHVSRLFVNRRQEIETTGAAEVELAGRHFTIKQQFIDDITQQNQQQRIATLRKALLVMHAPLDEIVSIDNASGIFQAAKHPKSFISLDNADHLLTDPIDANYVAEAIAAWSERYVAQLQQSSHTEETIVLAGNEVLVQETGDSFLTNAIITDNHRLIADEPLSVGGNNLGPDPYQYLLAALGACTSMTLRLYAKHKGLNINQIGVKLGHQKIHAQDCEECETETGKLDQITRELFIDGELTDAQRQRLVEIADKCPVHKTLKSEINIRTNLATE